jgi:hypothetical protein
MGQYSISTLVELPFDQALRDTHRTLAEEEFVVSAVQRDDGHPHAAGKLTWRET